MLVRGPGRHIGSTNGYERPRFATRYPGGRVRGPACDTGPRDPRRAPRTAPRRPPVPRDRSRAGRPPAEGVLDAALRGGVDIVQLRDKDAGDEEILAAAAVARRLCDEAGALFILNDRPDLVAPAHADGVHVGQDDGTAADARAAAGPDAIVGRSTHAPAQLAQAADDGADYAGVGPVHATPTKPGRAPVGLAYVRQAADQARMPWFAIGGIDAENAGEVVAAGAPADRRRARDRRRRRPGRRRRLAARGPRGERHAGRSTP